MYLCKVCNAQRTSTVMRSFGVVFSWCICHLYWARGNPLKTTGERPGMDNPKVDVVDISRRWMKRACNRTFNSFHFISYKTEFRILHSHIYRLRPDPTRPDPQNGWTDRLLCATTAQMYEILNTKKLPKFDQWPTDHRTKLLTRTRPRGHPSDPILP